MRATSILTAAVLFVSVVTAQQPQKASVVLSIPSASPQSTVKFQKIPVVLSIQKPLQPQPMVKAIPEPAPGVFEPLNLPSGATTLLGSIDTSFSCDNRPYGYYADVDNACRVFHICYPALFEDKSVQVFQYSFMCGEDTVYDQKELICVKAAMAMPCGEAPKFYSRNNIFGLPHEKN